jgi:hypothetical protein
MSQLVMEGKRRSKLMFVKVAVFEDRVEIKRPVLPVKTMMRDDITSWTEINKKLNTGLTWTEFTFYTAKTKYMLNSLHWQNYAEIRDLISNGKHRDVEKEQKTYKSFW